MNTLLVMLLLRYPKHKYPVDRMDTSGVSKKRPKLQNKPYVISNKYAVSSNIDL